MRLSLVPPDHPTLRSKGKRIADPRSVAALADDLLETMAAEGGVGLAAPQVGKPLRIFVTRVEEKTYVCINPKLTKQSEETIRWEEGCLSLPRLLGEVERPKTVTLRATDASGRSFNVSADGLLARVFQHEIDHLDGILFPDRMADLAQLQRLTEAEWNSRYGDDAAVRE